LADLLQMEELHARHLGGVGWRWGWWRLKIASARCGKRGGAVQKQREMISGMKWLFL